MKTLKGSILSRSSHNSDAIKNIILIEKWLEEYGIKNYTINKDYTIDVDGNINLYKKTIGKFPDYIQFGVVRGQFSCEKCYLTSLRGCPKKVEGFFNCSSNNLTSLEGCPLEVGETFYCDSNELTSLKGAPKKVGEDFSCRYNKLTSLEGSPEIVRNFYCSHNNLTSLEGAPEEIGGSFYCKFNSVKFTVDDINKVCKVNKNIQV